LVFQNYSLYPWRTVSQNIAFGLELAGLRRDEIERRVDHYLDVMQLTKWADARPSQLSGGMRQRVAIARSLATEPEVLLLDEPFGALDALTRIKMQDLLLDVHKAEPTTVLLVTHDVDEALQLADRIIVLGTADGGQGATIVRTVDVPGSRPRDRASAELATLRVSLLASLGVDGH
jgi:sulfonate transport system ATP-binding protein